MTRGVIDAFEIVEIQDDEGERQVVAFRVEEFAFEEVVERASVRQAREMIGQGETLGLFE